MSIAPAHNSSQWSVAVGVAVAAHLALALGFAGYSRHGAVGEGHGGVEIGLGLLGDAGESAISTDSGGSRGESSEAESPPPVAEPAPGAEPVQAPTPPIPPAAPGPVPSRAIEMQQSDEVKLAETSNPAAVPEPSVDDMAAPESPMPASPDDAPDRPDAALAVGTEASVAVSSGTENALRGVQGSGDDAISGRRRSTGAGDSPGAGGTPGPQAGYAARLAARLNRYKHFPMAARRARLEGIATLLLRVRRDGSVADYRISDSSGFEALDAAVLRMLDRAQPLPAFPAGMPDDEVSVSIPVSFSLSPL